MFALQVGQLQQGSPLFGFSQVKANAEIRAQVDFPVPSTPLKIVNCRKVLFASDLFNKEMLSWFPTNSEKFNFKSDIFSHPPENKKGCMVLPIHPLFLLFKSNQILDDSIVECFEDILDRRSLIDFNFA